MPSYYQIHGLRAPNIDDPTFTCPKPGCQRPIVLKEGKTGRLAGLRYLACFNDLHSDAASFWHVFKRGQAPTSTRPVISAATPAQGSPASRCATRNCPSVRIARLCTSRRCRKHCLEMGGCRCHVPPPPPSIILPALSEPALAALRGFEAYANIVPDYIEQGRLAARQAQDQEAAELREEQNFTALLGALRAKWREEDEAADLDYALYLSMISSPASSSPNLVFPSPSNPSPSVVSHSSSSANVVAPSPSNPSTSVTSQSSSGANIAFPSSSSPSTRDSFIKEPIHRVLLVYWPKHNKPATLQVVQDCAVWPQSWPRLRLSDIAPYLVSGVDARLDLFYECYCPTYRSWMKIPTDYVHSVETDQPLLIRRVGVVGSDEAEQLQLRDPASKERKDKMDVIEVDDESDVEIVEIQRPIKIEPGTLPPRTKCAHLAPAAAYDDDDDDDIIILDDQLRLIVAIPPSSSSASLPSLTYSSGMSSYSSLPSLSPSPDLPDQILPPMKGT
ncbi:hypothetical protein B0H17DRAFT_1140170 [Mycena rosella]|uniref:Uncharacterized protein n=1 Tax=Mycena rosella TaxID=1033263 RepID=A0AAD7D310_MYCRO|nr:hypothetical protein B0H17DRAFT_1140170 [Mycena rosella]